MNCPHCQAPNADDARFCGVCGRAMLATASDPKMPAMSGDGPAMIGREIAGRYRMQSKLGEGGMGAVYKAEQISLKRTVAVKLLRPEVASSQALLQRFNAEAQLVAKLNHPNTVNIYDFGQDADGTLFIAMEYIDGASLRSVIHKEAPLPLRRALSIAAQVAASLTDAHANSIIHRDLKPDNVMLQERGRQRDVARVLDFGIAKLRDENRQSQFAMTQAGDMLGTPQYMAPEQIRAETIDGRTDVYALGCMLYEMITGRLPFEAPTVMSLLSKHLTETTVPPSQRRPDLGIAPAVDQLILSAMSKDPRARPATMEAFGEQLAAMLATLPVDSQQQTAPRDVAPGFATPPAYSATPGAGMPFVPSGPGAGHAPSGQPGVPGYGQAHAPGHAPSGPPPGAAFAPASHTAAPYDPHARPHAPSPGPTLNTRGGGNKALWILLGVLALTGGGVGIYFATRTSAPAQPAPLAGSGSDVVAVSAEEAGVPPPIDAAATIVDPWKGDDTTANGAADPDDDAADPPAPMDTRGATKLMQGVMIKLPAGFKVQTSSSTQFLAADSRGVAVIAFPIDRGSNDIATLAGAYAQQAGLEVVETDTETIAGGQHGTAVLTGSIKDVPVMHLAVALIGPGFRVGVVVHLPMSLIAADQSVAVQAAQMLQNNLIVPANLRP